MTAPADEDPSFEWLDHEEIRELVHRVNDLVPEKRLMLLEGQVPGLVEDRTWERVQAAKRTIEQLQPRADFLATKAEERERIRAGLTEAHQAIGVITELQASAACHQFKAALDNLSEIYGVVEARGP